MKKTIVTLLCSLLLLSVAPVTASANGQEPARKEQSERKPRDQRKPANRAKKLQKQQDAASAEVKADRTPGKSDAAKKTKAERKPAGRKTGKE